MVASLFPVYLRHVYFKKTFLLIIYILLELTIHTACEKGRPVYFVEL